MASVHTMHIIIKFLKEWTLPVAIITGTALYFLFALTPCLSDAGIQLGKLFDQLFPFCVFLTMFTTFTKVNFHKMRLRCWHLHLTIIQLLLISVLTGSIILFVSDRELKLLLEAMLTCVIAPCATAAPVVTGKLGGDINSMTTYTLISSLLCSLTIPAVFPMLEKVEGVSFVTSMLTILEKISIVLLLPLVLGYFVRHYIGPLYRFILRHPNLSFYFWALSLAITSGITVKNIYHSDSSITILLLIALLSLAVCFVHFIIGRQAGRHFSEPTTCPQGMFQKNTAMAIWVSYMYLNPTASIGAGCYVLWQNIINSWEIAAYQHKKQ